MRTFFTLTRRASLRVRLHYVKLRKMDCSFCPARVLVYLLAVQSSCYTMGCLLLSLVQVWPPHFSFLAFFTTILEFEIILTKLAVLGACNHKNLNRGTVFTPNMLELMRRAAL
jgi:hypothetical protein